MISMGSALEIIVLLELLNNELKNNAEDQEILIALDEELKSIFNNSDFVWETGLKRAFPKKEFWYLYGYLG